MRRPEIPARPATPAVRRSKRQARVRDIAADLVTTFGPEARSVVYLNAAECQAVGDAERRSLWEAVGAAVEMLLLDDGRAERALH